MRIISSQFNVSIPITMKKLGKKEHRIAVNLLSPDYGVCVDGHHEYFASLVDHKPLTIVTLGLKMSEDNTGAGLLDFWMREAGAKPDDNGKYEWRFYDLMTGYEIDPRILQKITEQYPDYYYTVG